jgi:hypothetical protein
LAAGVVAFSQQPVRVLWFSTCRPFAATIAASTSAALPRLVAAKVQADPASLGKVRENVRRWQASDGSPKLGLILAEAAPRTIYEWYLETMCQYD